jgi:argininosuccinate lyase
MSDTKHEEKTGLWGGRFEGATNEDFAAFNRSFGFDIRLLPHDCRASAAHAEALSKAGVLSIDEVSKLKAALAEIAALKALPPADAFEDVHSFIESELVKRLGDVGKKIHAGRSRNDQVATAFRLWTREACDRVNAALQGLQGALLDHAKTYENAVIPGYTHLQKAQPILWAHWCLAYFEMFSRDRQRLADARKRINILPLGSGALAGSSYAVDRKAVAQELGFEGISRNSLDAVSDRDFCVEFSSVASLAMVHLSRFSEDLILYTSQEFGFAELSDAISTGSSLMPQKKNPDALELLRGKSGRVFGHLTAFLSLLKGLPLAYNKDLQEDKEALFDAADTTEVSLKIGALVLKNLRIKTERTALAARTGYMNATELADYLVRKGIPFRTAHDSAGKIVLKALSKNVEIEGLGLTEMQAIHPKIEQDVFQALSLERTLASKNVTGGTAPERVAEALRQAIKETSKAF